MRKSSLMAGAMVVALSAGAYADEASTIPRPFVYEYSLTGQVIGVNYKSDPPEGENPYRGKNLCFISVQDPRSPDLTNYFTGSRNNNSCQTALTAMKQHKKVTTYVTRTRYPSWGTYQDYLMAIEIKKGKTRWRTPPTWQQCAPPHQP